MRNRLLLSLLAASLMVLTLQRSRGNGVLRDGYGANSMAMGGTSVAYASEPLGSMGGNPATLALLDRPMIAVSLTGIHGQGWFENALNDHAELQRDSGAFPEFAVSYPITDSPFTIGFAIKADSVRLADWDLVDTPGGVDGATTYGRQTHRSEFTALSATLGVGMELTERLSVGIGVGLVYHRVALDVPFIFQSEPTLLGWKTLLDIETEGYGWNANVGLLYQVNDDVTFGLSYQTRADLNGTGKARGNVSAQLDSLGLTDVERGFRYDAEIETALPQSISSGLSWQIHERLRLALQVDWISWSDAFDELRISLDDGSNSAINGLTGSASLRDTVPVRWSDRLVYRAGLEYAAADDVRLQLGYSYGRSPVPRAYTTPLNGSIFEHTLTAGIQMERGPWNVGLAYQYHLPNTESVDESAYRSGEYSNSSLKLAAHLLTLSCAYKF